MLGTELSRAEQRVLALLHGDRTLAEIARELYLSRKTINSHTHRIYQRLGVRSREHALADGARAGSAAGRSRVGV